jgi:hypothetical protein
VRKYVLRMATSLSCAQFGATYLQEALGVKPSPREGEGCHIRERLEFNFDKRDKLAAPLLMSPPASRRSYLRSPAGGRPIAPLRDSYSRPSLTSHE